MSKRLTIGEEAEIVSQPDSPYAVRTPADHVILCVRCDKQRWRPRVPDALQGWIYSHPWHWLCPDCQTLEEREKRQG